MKIKAKSRLMVLASAFLILFLICISSTALASAMQPTFVTEWGELGTYDGAFMYPEGIAVDASGNVYVADSWNDRVQKFDSNGTFITKWGSYGSEDGQFDYPNSIAVDSSGNVYVSDAYSVYVSGTYYDTHARIQKFDSNGAFITKWGSYGSGDGQFEGIGVDSSGNVYVSDSFNACIQKFDSNGAFITKWGSYGSEDGQFKGPGGVAVDSSGNVYVADTANTRIQKFDSNGAFITKWGSEGSEDGQFIYPYDVAVDSSGNIYVDDTGNNRVQKFVLEKITPTIIWNNPADTTVGTALGPDQFNAIATDPYTGNSVPGTFTYNPEEGNVLEVGTHTLKVDFTPTDTANYNSVSQTVTINVLKATPAITWSNPADITYGTALSSAQLSASTSVSGTFVYNRQSGDILDVGTHTLHVDFTPTDTVNYNIASKDVTINVLKATPTVTWNNPADITYGTLLSAIQLNAEASVPGNLVYTPPEGTKLDVGTEQTLHVEFIPDSSIANNYNGASKEVKINVNKADPIITWNNPADITYGTLLTETQLNAKADVPGTFVYTPEAGTVLGAGMHTLHVDFMPSDTASYTNTYKDVTINIVKATPTITWNDPEDITSGTVLSDIQLNAFANVYGTFIYTPPAGTILDVGTHMLHVNFAPSNSENYTEASKDVIINIVETTVPAPIINYIIVPPDPVPIGTNIAASASVTYLGSLSDLTAEWNWGDGSTSDSQVSSSTFDISHVYNSPGVYTVTFTVKDNNGRIDTKQASDYIVVYDPQGGFVTGGGWINSPAGAYVADKNLAGKATFGFVSKYQKGATVPTGNTEFQFKVANLNLKSTSYDWLVVSGPLAKYKGTGTINGEGNYGFMLSAVDGAIKGDGIDKFRIKIWDKETDEIVYDNEIGVIEDAQPSTAISGGSIVIHKEK